MPTRPTDDNAGLVVDEEDRVAVGVGLTGDVDVVKVRRILMPEEEAQVAMAVIYHWASA